MKVAEPAKEEMPPLQVTEPENPTQEEAAPSKEEKERTPSPPLKTEVNESEALKELKAKLK